LKVIITDQSFDPWMEMAKYQESYLEKGKHGGTVAFIGTMRDFNEGVEDISAMYLDHYPGMTEKHIERICAEAMEEWDVIDAFVVHRVGEIKPDEAIVLVGVWSKHRAMAFDASRFIINDLKHRAPFWKRETRPEGEAWVQGNSTDVNAAKINKNKS